MLSPKFSSPSLLAKSWLPKSSVRPSSPKPIAHTRVSLFQADSTSAKRLIFKRSYYKSSSTNTRASSRTSKPRSMLAAAAAVAVGSAGAAGYSTSTKDSNPNVTNTKDASFTPKFESAAFQIPHPEKADKGGEDTYLVSSDGLMLGVFDGTSSTSLQNTLFISYSSLELDTFSHKTVRLISLLPTHLSCYCFQHLQIPLTSPLILTLMCFNWYLRN